MSLPACERCGHSAKAHNGVSKKGYSFPATSCLFETDRYELCTCDAYVNAGVTVQKGCTCIPSHNPTVIGASGCRVHGMKTLRAILAQAVKELRGHDDRLSNQELRDTVDDFIASAASVLNHEESSS